jgi:phosphatidylserine decarboxylase
MLVAAAVAAALSVLAAIREGKGRALPAGALAALGSLVFFAQFFRNPGALTPVEAGLVVAPAFGRVVHIGEEEESEMLGGRRVRISIFLSLFDPHLTRAPVGGRILTQRHTSGRYLVALHPKASALNERNSIVIETAGGAQVLVRSIAGLLARRICSYVEPGVSVEVGQEIGYIKLGSRVDIFLPIGASILARPGQKVRAGETPLARIGRDPL